MKISFSNIAWDVDKDESVAGLLVQNDISYIDIAPTKYFPDPYSASEKVVREVRELWLKRGLKVYGMQALLYGTTGLNIFSGPVVQNKMLNYLEQIFRIASSLGTHRLVFGSPKNRNVGDLEWEAALNIGVNFFKRLGDLALNYDVIICVEPNPVEYNCNFMTNMASMFEMISMVDHRAVKAHLDLGSLTMNEESLSQALELYGDSIYHIHISEPYLQTICGEFTDHEVNGILLNTRLPNAVVAIEMAAVEPELQYDSIESALKLVKKYYG